MLEEENEREAGATGGAGGGAAAARSGRGGSQAEAEGGRAAPRGVGSGGCRRAGRARGKARRIPVLLPPPARPPAPPVRSSLAPAPTAVPVGSARMATQMTDAHRHFLQALMSLGVVESPQAVALHRQCCELHKVHYAADKLDDFIGVANLQLQPLFLEIRKGMAEETGRTCYALVNLAESEVTRMASDYSETELELFKKTMDLIVLSENGFASSTEILNVADQLKPKKMKKREAEQVLQRLVEDRWLSEKEGELTLHPRCILELEQYILSHYPDTARKCHICHALVVQSQVCADCGISMHAPCLARYFRGKTEPRCPRCKQLWPPGTPAVSQLAAPLSSGTPKESRRTSSSSAGPRRR